MLVMSCAAAIAALAALTATAFEIENHLDSALYVTKLINYVSTSKKSVESNGTGGRGGDGHNGTLLSDGIDGDEYVCPVNSFTIDEGGDCCYMQCSVKDILEKAIAQCGTPFKSCLAAECRWTREWSQECLDVISGDSDFSEDVIAWNDCIVRGSYNLVGMSHEAQERSPEETYSGSSESVTSRTETKFSTSSATTKRESNSKSRRRRRSSSISTLSKSKSRRRRSSQQNNQNPSGSHPASGDGPVRDIATAPNDVAFATEPEITNCVTTCYDIGRYTVEKVPAFVSRPIVQ